jgi:hypothetical protein
MPARAILIAFVISLSGPAFADCREPETGTRNIPIFSPPLGAVVTGAGRLQFYSAPNVNCAMAGVFVIPKDELITYAQSNDGWSSVMYSNPRTGKDVSGKPGPWVTDRAAEVPSSATRRAARGPTSRLNHILRFELDGPRQPPRRKINNAVKSCNQKT